MSGSPAANLERLLAASASEQRRAGYADTVREILQQPATWHETADLLASSDVSDWFARMLGERPQQVVFTGSGSSAHVGECVAAATQAALGIPCRAIPAGDLLTDAPGLLAPGRGVIVSIARSGDSPESGAVVDALLASAPDCTHLIVTCNAHGRLATAYENEPRVRVLLLDARTNDRSLVMTSSFTNLLLAAGALAQRADARPQTQRAATLAQRVFDLHADALADAARADFSAAVFLASPGSSGAARECALKMLEMSGGAVATLTETFLGLRHGPMSALNRPSLVVALLSARADVRAYEYDLLDELARKRLGARRVIVGDGIPPGLVRDGDVAIDLPGLDALGAVQRQSIDVVVGQLLALFRCLHLGQRPDAPAAGVLSRVVEPFAIHARGAGR